MALPDSRPTLLLFADISGYTHYIQHNPYTAAHAVLNISRLLDAVTQALEPAFVISKLEGDAVLCHRTDKQAADSALHPLLISMFHAFDARKAWLQQHNTCSCQACTGLASLELKAILHAGEVVHFRSRLGMELGGEPVILLHRLAKNTCEGNRYILWTETVPGLSDNKQDALRTVQCCEGLGEVPVSIDSRIPHWQGTLPASRRLRWCDHVSKAAAWLRLRLAGTAGRAQALAGNAAST